MLTKILYKNLFQVLLDFLQVKYLLIITYYLNKIKLFILKLDFKFYFVNKIRVYRHFLTI